MSSVQRQEPPSGEERGQRGASPALVSTPLLAALQRAGTRHVYADTADLRELASLLRVDGGLRAEIDGNTANQPLVRKVVERVLDAGLARELAQAAAARPMAPGSRMPRLYALLCARIGRDLADAFAAGRAWEVSLQLHMSLCSQPARARELGRLLRREAPSALVKVPFTPDAPACLLVARDLEREGIPVNLTSTFSARQVVVAALLSNVARTNIFMGRLNQGLEARLLGEHVDLEAQRALSALRRDGGVRTQLIVASLRDWQSLVRVAGCDVFTAPCDVLRGFLAQDEVAPDEIRSQLETSYESELGVSQAVQRVLGADRIARLYRVEPELVEFLHSYGGSREYAATDDPDALHARFDEAGFADLFHAPTSAERDELARGKLPALDGALVRTVPLDTHYTLLANADFSRVQREIDAEIEARVGA